MNSSTVVVSETDSSVTSLAKLPELLKFHRRHPDAVLPTVATSGSAGADLYSVEAFTLSPGERRLVRTGWAVEFASPAYIQIVPRSGLAYKYGVTVLNSPGTIDSDYRGELGVILINLGLDDYHVAIGERIAQMIVSISETLAYSFEEVEEISDTERGAGGFGSTGKH